MFHFCVVVHCYNCINLQIKLSLEKKVRNFVFSFHNKFLMTISKSLLSFTFKPKLDLFQTEITSYASHTHKQIKDCQNDCFYISSCSPTLMKNVSLYSCKIESRGKYLVIKGKKCTRLERNCLTRSFVFRSPQTVVLTECLV